MEYTDSAKEEIERIQQEECSLMNELIIISG